MNSLGKRERRHQRIQTVSPSILLAKGEEKKQKNSQAVSPLNLLARERSEWRRRVAQVFEKWTFLGKEGIEQKLLERSWEINQKFL